MELKLANIKVNRCPWRAAAAEAKPVTKKCVSRGAAYVLARTIKRKVIAAIITATKPVATATAASEHQQSKHYLFHALPPFNVPNIWTKLFQSVPSLTGAK